MQSCNTKKEGEKAEKTDHDFTKETFSMQFMVKEDKRIADSVISLLNAQHHQLKVLERRSVPGPFTPADTRYYSDYAVKLEKLPVINPGPGEYVHVMDNEMDIRT